MPAARSSSKTIRICIQEFMLVWPTCRTPAVGGLIVCVCVCDSVCPKTCRHIARRMMND